MSNKRQLTDRELQARFDAMFRKNAAVNEKELQARYDALFRKNAAVSEEELQARVNRLKQQPSKKSEDEQLKQRRKADPRYNEMEQQFKKNNNPHVNAVYHEVNKELKKESIIKQEAKENRERELANEQHPGIKRLMQNRNRAHDQLDKRMLSSSRENIERKSIEIQFLQAKVNLLKKTPQTPTPANSQLLQKQEALRNKQRAHQATLERGRSAMARAVKRTTTTLNQVKSLQDMNQHLATTPRLRKR